MTAHLDASPVEVWAHLRDIADHVTWMADAETIRLTSAQTEGQGTTFECDTKVGPLRLTDVMEITEWEPERRMGVRHTGVVTGTGRFTLAPSARGGTILSWDAKRFSTPSSVFSAMGFEKTGKLGTVNVTLP